MCELIGKFQRPRNTEGLRVVFKKRLIRAGVVEDGALVCERLPAGNYRLEAAAPKEVCFFPK